MKLHATSLGLILLSLACFPLYRGGYPLWPQAAFGMVAALALLIAPRVQRQRADQLYTWAFVIWFMWLLWQVLQCYPLPIELLMHVAPESLALWEQAHTAGLNAAPKISLTPAISIQQAIASAGLLSLYLAIRAVLRTYPKWQRHFLWGIVLIGAFQAIYGTLAHLTHWELSWIEPAWPVHDRVAHGSFPNRNHYAAFLIPAFACALALALGTAGDGKPKWKSSIRQALDFVNGPIILLRVIMLTLVIGVVLSQSRMGNTALAFGASVFGLIWLLKTRSTVSFAKILFLFVSIAVVDVLLISDRFGLERVIERIEDTDVDSDTRATARSMSWQLIERFGLAGAGHGSFAYLEHQVRPNPKVGYLHHAHNDHLEFIIEFGWIGYSILAALLMLHIGMATRALQSRRVFNRACGAAFLMSSSAAMLHATVEYLFHIPAWRAVFVSMMAMVAAIPPPGRRKDRSVAATTNDFPSKSAS